MLMELVARKISIASETNLKLKSYSLNILES